MHHRVELDAMGHDKRRAVVGKSYGPSARQQLTVYGTFIAVMAVLVVGFLLLAQELDKAPDTNPDVAPWSASDAPQRPPGDIDDSKP
jgi:hypothetical protein